MSASARPDGDPLLNRGLSPENRDHEAAQPAPARRGGHEAGTRDTGTREAGNREAADRGGDRHASRDDDSQISVQDLLRRSQTER